MSTNRNTHDYKASIVWEGNTGTGTSAYAAYERAHRIIIDGKPDIPGSSDPAFRGDPSRHNPEDLFLSALSGCHMLFYLYLCSANEIRVISYEDDARGTMTVNSEGGGKFDIVTLHPRVVIAAGNDETLAFELHDKAHELCYIANSCSIPIHHEPTITST